MRGLLAAARGRRGNEKRRVRQFQMPAMAFWFLSTSCAVPSLTQHNGESGSLFIALLLAASLRALVRQGLEDDELDLLSALAELPPVTVTMGPEKVRRTDRRRAA